MSRSPNHLNLLIAEASKRKPQVNPDSLVDLGYVEQSAFVLDEARYISALCTRRAGKSYGLGLKMFKAALQHTRSLTPYISLTRDSAKNIMWPVLQEINDRFKLGAVFKESSLSVVLPNRSIIKLFGADMKNFIRRLRGPKYPFVGVDEAQAFGEHLHELIDDVLTPAISDYTDGQIAITGTPGPIADGLFHDITTGDLGYSKHAWSVFENPYMPNPKAFVADLKKRKKWSDDNPTLRREWYGEWVTDPDALCYKFDRAKNLCDQLPVNSDPWFHVLGVDLGYDPDPSAFVLCAYQLSHPNLFVVDTYSKTKMIISDVAVRIRSYQKLYPHIRIIMDLGAQGKQIGEEIRQRYKIPVIAADKAGKSGFIEIMNSDFISGNIKLVKSKTKGLQDEYKVLAWDSSAHDRREDKRYLNNLADAFLYSWRWCYNYAWQQKEIAPNVHSEEYLEQFWEREAEKLEREKSDPLRMT